MSEKLGFQERLCDGSAIDRNECMVAPLAAPVNESCNHLLAGSGLARQQHRGRLRRDLVGEAENLFHGCAFRDNIRRKRGICLLLVQLRPVSHGPAAQDLLDYQSQFFRAFQRFGQVFLGAQLDGLYCRRHRSVVGQNNDRRFRGVLAYPAQEFDSAHVRHPFIGYDQAETAM